MPAETERRFLIRSETWRESVQSSVLIEQVYFATGAVTVRLRLTAPWPCTAETQWMAAYLTLKGPKQGAVAPEFEYSVPVAHALEMLETLPMLGSIRKVRHRIPQEGLTWEVDEFHQPRAGLVIAEIELPAADTPVAQPAWVGEEITERRDLSNAAIARNALQSAE